MKDPKVLIGKGLSQKLNRKKSKAMPKNLHFLQLLS
jgi:hypothetical protein